jgi:hypothetical protein
LLSLLFPVLRWSRVAYSCFYHGSDFASLWSKTAENQLTRGEIWVQLAQLSFLPRYFSYYQLSFSCYCLFPEKNPITPTTTIHYKAAATAMLLLLQLLEKKLKTKLFPRIFLGVLRTFPDFPRNFFRNVLKMVIFFSGFR